MQFIIYNPHWDPAAAQTPPSPDMLAALSAFTAEAIQAGVIVTTGGLQPTGTRLKLADGKFTVTDGPFIELKELTGGFAVIQAKSIEEAIEWSKRFQEIIGDGEFEIVPIFGPMSA